MRHLIFTLFLAFTASISWSQKSYLGINSNRLHPKKAEKLNLPSPYGVYVTSVSESTAADKAGLETFDYIYKVGEYNLSKYFTISNALKQYQPEDKVDILFVRDGKKKKKTAVLGSIKERRNDSRSSEEDPFLGIHQSHDRKPDNKEGVMVNIGDGTTADLIGMEDGDLVMRVDDNPIIDWHDVSAAIDDREVGENIEVTVYRDGEEISLSGKIKSEDGETTLDQKIDMEYMDVSVEPMPEEELETLDIPEDELSLETLELSNLSLFPNPNIGRFTVDLELNGTGDVSLQLFDSQGKLVLNENLQQASGKIRKDFDLGTSPAGVYYLKVIQGEKIMTRKVIVARS